MPITINEAELLNTIGETDLFYAIYDSGYVDTSEDEKLIQLVNDFSSPTHTDDGLALKRYLNELLDAAVADGSFEGSEEWLNAIRNNLK